MKVRHSVTGLFAACKSAVSRNSLELQQHANRATDVSFLPCIVLKYYEK